MGPILTSPSPVSNRGSTSNRINQPQPGTPLSEVQQCQVVVSAIRPFN